MNVRCPYGTGRVVSVAVVVAPGDPKATQRSGDEDGNGCFMGIWSPGFWVGLKTW